jgi:F-type H+-transporting ATPase subunit a
VRVNGPLGYLKELVGEPRYMAPLMFPIHLISELSRLVSLSMRLFGNVFAGEVLLATMLALTTGAVVVLPLAFFVPGIFLGLELLFGFVQAMVFALLTMTYITLAIGEHHEKEHAETSSTDHEPSASAPA